MADDHIFPGDFMRWFVEHYENLNPIKLLLTTLVTGPLEAVSYRLDAISTQVSKLPLAQSPTNVSGGTDIQPILAALTAFQEQTMARLDDIKQQAAANAAQAQSSADLATKNQNELKAQLARVADLTTQSADIQARIDTAVNDAKTAQRAEDDAANAAALDEIATLQAQQTALQTQLQDTLRSTDALVDDIVAPPATPPATETSPATGPTTPTETSPATGTTAPPPVEPAQPDQTSGQTTPTSPGSTPTP